MNTDDFEKRLQQQPMRQVPTEWRAEVLQAARTAANSNHESRITNHESFLSTLNSQLRALLWPCPQAWAGLAAVWVAIFALNFSTHEPRVVVKNNSAPHPRETQTALLDQRRELNRLLDSLSPSVAQHFPSPRSERRREIGVA
jgi:hypothetical protein